MKIKPAPGIKIWDPFTFSLLPDDGAEVEGNGAYWTRSLIAGDVVEFAEEPAAPEIVPEPAPEE